MEEQVKHRKILNEGVAEKRQNTGVGNAVSRIWLPRVMMIQNIGNGVLDIGLNIIPNFDILLNAFSLFVRSLMSFCNLDR